MGLYDSVLVKCPICSYENEFQSKSGDCILNTYFLQECPEDILLDVNRHSPCTCVNCGCKYSVDLSVRPPVPVIHKK